MFADVVLETPNLHDIPKACVHSTCFRSIRLDPRLLTKHNIKKWINTDPQLFLGGYNIDERNVRRYYLHKKSHSKSQSSHNFWHRIGKFFKI